MASTRRFTRPTTCPLPRPLIARCGAGLIAAAVLAGSSGCAVQPVAPWQKGLLAKPEMSFDPDRLEAAFNEHVYTSKEAAAGGAAVGGGGCGCN